METISIIIPCYNEEEAIPVYYETMVRQMDEMEEQQKVQFELIFVDDGSKDHSLFEMRRLAQKDMRCRYLSFSRNFGKEAAMYAGLQAAKGDYVTVMDVDLQDPPSLLPKMYAMLQSGTCDCVAARRSSREGEGKIKSFLSNAFYGVINRLSRTEIVSGARDYRLMSRKMVEKEVERIVQKSQKRTLIWFSPSHFKRLTKRASIWRISAMKVSSSSLNSNEVRLDGFVKIPQG